MEAAELSVEPEYPWPRPPVGGYTADDLDRLPRLPPHTELIDGSFVRQSAVRSPQSAFHDRAMWLLENGLLQAAPPEWDVCREMTITLGPQNRPEPDVTVIRAAALTDLSQTSFQPADVLLAIEVVSPDSESRDRETKPGKYARAGIPHFWRVENNSGEPVVHAFELEPTTQTYAVTGIHHELLKVSVPFPIDIDLTAIHRR